MLIFLSSSGPLISSIVRLLNSVNSSRNRTPIVCEAYFSAVLVFFLLRTSEAFDIVWCGLLNGLVVIIGVSFSIKPAMLWIFVISRASSRLKSGRIVGRHFESKVLPEPGTPDKENVVVAALLLLLKLF